MYDYCYDNLKYTYHRIITYIFYLFEKYLSYKY